MKKKNDVPRTDEELLEMHRQERTRHRRRRIITLVVVVAVVLVAVAVGVTQARKSISAQVSSSEDSAIQSAEVTVSSISTTVSGSGTLADEDVESVEIPDSLEIADFYVEEGDTVSEGDLIATVTNASILTAMSDAQASLDALDEEIEEAADDEVEEEITTSVPGRVKVIYAEEDDDVATVMYEHGALMLLSLDGYMAVDVASDALTVGDEVTVTDSDGDEYDGTVEEVVDGTATVLITDKGPGYGDEVTVTDSDGSEVGTGTLYIHSSLAITGYAGTVEDLEVSENEAVDAGDTLLTLTDTETSANYDALLKEREETEELLEDLIAIYKEGGICATVAGEISSLSEDSGSSSSSSDLTASMTDSSTSSDSSSGYTTVATISTNENMIITISVDETDILSLSEGQEATVTIDSIGEDTYAGTVTEISTTAESSSGVTSYSADITIDKTDDMLSGMSASVVITIEGVDNALLIPADALHQTSSTAYVYTEYDESTGEFSGMVEVTVGLTNSSYAEITEGLSEGDTVYYTESSDDSSSFDLSSFGNMGGMSDFSGGMDSNSGGMDNNSGGRGEMPGGN
ncbi:MAG: HlyD family efflux transporter periplasmic adaptor subunit [Lachnospiraceae bacterium]|nr:HlyD family efflux transporter periplasmic adaptor subunit [Lachnospiraceae bacterium]